MPAQLPAWASKHAQTFPISVLNKAYIGIDASYYLDQILNNNNEEPLKVALGGVPFCLTARIEEDIQTAKDAGIKLIFVFDGLDYVNKAPPHTESPQSRNTHEEGWTLYMQGNGKETVDVLGKAGYSLELVQRHLRKVLHANDVEFVIAPFSAMAFLAYLYNLKQGQPIDTIMTSTDAFLFNVDKVIVNLDAKNQKFSWVSKQDCVAAAGNPSPSLFRDAQLLLGSAFLPPFPPLTRPATAKIQDVLGMLTRSPVLQLFHLHREDPEVVRREYADRYKKALMTIRHHVIVTPDGHVQPTDLAHAPGDVHAFVGQRLPDELFFYIFRGVMAPQVPNWLTTGEINLILPGGPIDCEPYRRLVIDQLNPLRLQSTKLLAESLHYYYQGREIKIRSWDGRVTTEKMKDLLQLRGQANQWKVKEASWSTAKSVRVPTVLSCLRLLKDKEFAQSTIFKGKPEHPMLKTQNEIVSNVFWRFLQIRGFVDDKHQLTQWGNMLEATLAVMDGGARKEEQGIIAVELLRLGVLNTQSPTGTPVQATDKSYEHKMYTNLLSKIACLGRLKHEPVGYVGPLDRSLLTFAWEISAIRQALRELCETILTTMFLNGDISRERDDWSELPQRLPFTSDNGSSLGIAVKIYLDALNDRGSTSDEVKQKIKSQEEPFNWFAKAEDGTIYKSLDTAFRLCDAVFAAVKVGEKEVKEAQHFQAAEKWLASRR